MCNMDCFNCCKADCDNNELTDTESKEQDKFDREVIGERKYGIDRKIWLYNNSEKGKEARKRYEQSEKGRATAKRKQQKRIASGKNAEYCRAYRQRKKEEAKCVVCIAEVLA